MGAPQRANRADTRQHPAARADADYPHKQHPTTSLDTRRHDRDLALGQWAGGVDPRSVSGRRRFTDAGVPAPWMTGRHENPDEYGLATTRGRQRLQRPFGVPDPIGLEQTMTPFERGHGPCSSFAPGKRATYPQQTKTKLPADHIFAVQRTFRTET
jgi:hypothetical protein